MIVREKSKNGQRFFSGIVTKMSKNTFCPFLDSSQEIINSYNTMFSIREKIEESA